MSNLIKVLERIAAALEKIADGQILIKRREKDPIRAQRLDSGLLKPTLAQISEIIIDILKEHKVVGTTTRLKELLAQKGYYANLHSLKSLLVGNKQVYTFNAINGGWRLKE